MTVRILNGNELLIQGGLEAGFQLYTGYPGSPLADFFNILHERKDELHAKGIRVVLSNSEAHAGAMASGAKMAGQNVLVAMKSMGLHVAADALSVGNFANPGALDAQGHKSGVVIAVGDDPWSISTSTPADSRFLFKHLHIPFLEPSTPQELKDWISVALELSQESSVYVGILLTTFMAEGGGRVEIKEEKIVKHEPITLDPRTFNLAENVMVPPNSLGADRRMINERFPQYLKALASKKLDKTFGNSKSPIAIISTGAAFEILKQVLEENQLMEQVHLYKCAGSYALNEETLVPFLKSHERVLVVEEKRGFLESEVKELAVRFGLELQVWGKKFGDLEGFPAHGGLNYELVHAGLKSALALMGSQCVLQTLPQTEKLQDAIPKRLPTFCPGCPHRETLSLMKELRADLATKNIQLVSHGDVGCYSLSFLEPFKEMHDLSAMGQGGAMGAGTDLFTTNPSVVLMGDSTFFHSGMTAISNSVQMGHNITYILLDNDNTAMTGHQVTPRTGISVEGEKRPRQNMLDIARSLQVSNAIEVNPSDRFFYKNLLTDYVMKPGVKVIVSNKECGLTFHGRKKREERALYKEGKTEAKRGFYQINTLACEDCRECVEMTGCPGLSQTQDAYGSKVMIDPQICVSDSYCTKLKACPSFELVEVSNYHPTKYQPKRAELSSAELGSPQLKYPLDYVSEGHDWRAVVIGVGGSGVTTISRVLAEAASDMGGRSNLDFKFVDQKGLAQRNGSVTSHLSLFSKSKSHGQLVPEGTAQVVVAPDLLEGARALPFLSPTGILVVDSEYQVPLSLLLDYEEKAPTKTTEELRRDLHQLLGDRLIIGPFKQMSYERYQRPVYSSAMLLGVMFQSGLLPFSLGNMEQAFKGSLPKFELSSNWEAFAIGRKWSLENPPGILPDFNQTADLVPMLAKSIRKVAQLWQNPARFVNSFNHHRRDIASLLPDFPENDIAQYVHDLYVYDQGKHINDFKEDILVLKSLELNPLELKVAVRTLARTYWVKDEVYVSHLMSSPLKKKTDQQRYRQLGTKFKVIHLNRPSFDVLGKKIEFDFSPTRWMLKIMRHLRILRVLMPSWHKLEKQIAVEIRKELLAIGKVSTEKRWEKLKQLENIKGYREVRYKKARQVLSVEAP